MAHLNQKVARLDQKAGVLPTQDQVQPNAHVNVVNLRSEKLLPEREGGPVKETVEVEDITEEEEAGTQDAEPMPVQKKALPKEKAKEKVREEIRIRPSFPRRLAKNKEAEEISKMIKIFKKVEVNVPLLTAITSMPRCAKLLKELCTKRVRYTNDARFQMGEHVSAVLKKDLPAKCDDPGMFFIPCVTGTTKIDQAMLDLGASINVMPLKCIRS